MHNFRRRGLPRLAAAAALVVATSILAVPPVSAAPTFNVNSTADQVDASLNGVCATAVGACTLRAAVQEANNTTGATIVVPAGTYLLSSGSSDATGDFDLRRPMTINGAAKQPGATATTINANSTERAIEVFGAGTTISGVVLVNGMSNSSGSPGGGIRVNSGAALTLVDSTVSNSQSNDGGGIANQGNLTVERSTISGNTASTKGGGIYSTGPLTVRNSTISGNRGKFGGGFRVSETTTITASTITGNTGTNDGGGIERSGGAINLRMTVVAGNTSPTGPECAGGPLTLTLQNHFGSTSGCTTTGPAPTTGNAQLGALADNGGPTRTHLPAANSPLIDKVTTANCSVAGGVDQRNLARPAGPSCDIGAVELARLAVDVTLDASPDPIGAGLATLPVENIPPDLLVDVSQLNSNLGSTGLSRFGLSRFGLSRFPMEDSGLSRFGLSRFGLSRFGLSRFGLSRFNLSDVPVEGGWEAVLAPEYAPDPVPPLQVLTLADVIEFPSVQALTLGQINLGATGLGEIPVMDFAFDGLDLERIPPTDDPALQDPTHDLDDERLAAWCDLLGDEACQRSGVDPDPTDAIAPDPATSDATMLTVSINSASLDSTGLSRFGLSRFGLSRFGLSRFAVWDTGLSRFVIEDMVLADVKMADLDLDAIDIDPAGLSRFGLSRFGLSRFGDSLDTIVDCSKVNCNDPDATLGDAADAGALTGDIGAFILAIVNEDITELEELTFLDLFPGLFVDLTYLPWETLDLDAAHLQNEADPLEPATTLTATINVTGGPANVDVDLTLPPNFVMVPDSARFDGNAIANPAQEAGTLEFTRTGVATGQHTLSVQARAGLELGEQTAHVDVAATAGALNASDSADATVTVVEAYEQGTAPKGLANNVLSVAHISSSLDEDVYEFEVTEEGTRVQLLLSGLAVDYDLLLQGPPTASLRGEPTQELRPVEDTGIGLDPRDEQAAPDVQYDVAVDPDRGAAYSIAASRGIDPETIETGILPLGTYRVTVQGYNGVFSASGYVLQMRTTVEDLPVATPRSFPFEGQVGDHLNEIPGVPAPSSTPADLDTLVLTAPRRTIATYGWERTEPVVDAAEAVANATAAGVSGVVVGVDADPDVADAYDAWDANRSSPQAANDVASAIAALIDDYRAVRPGIENVVLVGDDGLVPFFRVADRTTLSPEVTYASAFEGNNELVGALARNYMLTDDPYGASAGIQTNVDELFVPELGVGRLGETPEAIATAMERFVEFDGKLDASTAYSALVAGYEFLGDGAGQVASNLDANNGATPVDTSLISETWTADDLGDALSGDPDVASINAHFDHSRLLPADQNAAGTETNLYEVSDLDALASQTLERSVVFSMGCHSALSVSDVELGSSERDWPEAFGERGSVYLGNTVYGYGDTELVSLSELLDAYFAQQLVGGTSVGQALMLAKQQYAAGLFALTPYDAKILQGFTLYGLPMFRLDDGAPAVQATALQSLAAATPLPDLDVDPITGLGVASISFDQPVGPTSGPGTLHENTTADGHGFFDVDGDTVQVQYRPVQPLTQQDVSRRDPDTGELVDRAHGVLWTDLTSTDLDDYTPLYYLPDPTGHTGDAGDLGPVGDAAFPAAPSRVTTAAAPDGGETQQVLFVPGVFRPNPATPGIGTQRLYTSADGIVLYADPDVDDYTPPTIAESHGAIIGGTVAFSIDTDATAQRVVVVFRELNSSDWRSVDLVRSAGTDHWTGGATVGSQLVEFGVQAADQAGNVAYSFNKTDNFLAVPPAGGQLTISLAAAQPPTAGWYRTQPVTATITGAPAGAVVKYSLDGAAFTTYTGPFPVTGQGIHFISAFDDADNLGAAVVPIDTAGPNASATVSPAALEGWRPAPTTVNISAIDPGGAGVAQIVWSASGAQTTPPTTVNGESAVASVSASGTTTVSFHAIDSAGNAGPTGTVTVKVDGNAPSVQCGAAPTAWQSANVSIACTATDAGIGLANAADASFDLSTSVPAGSETANAATGTRNVCDKLAQCATAGLISGIKVDRKAPSITITAPIATNYTIGQVVNAAFTCSDGGSGVASCVGSTANGAAISTTPGAHTFTVTATDNVGNSFTKEVKYTVGYRICLQYNANQAKNIGSAFPIVLQICDAAGNNLSSASIQLRATSVDGTIDPGPNDSGNANNGYFFRFDNGSYKYNLKTDFLTPGSHNLFFTVSNVPGVEFSAPFKLKL